MKERSQPSLCDRPPPHRHRHLLRIALSHPDRAALVIRISEHVAVYVVVGEEFICFGNDGEGFGA